MARKPKPRKGTKGQKCVKFGRTKRDVCIKWKGGKKQQGRPGKKCVKTEKKTVDICREFGG